jgi:hypothetical protein
MMVKLTDYNDRLTQAVLLSLLTVLKGNKSKLTVGYQQLKLSLSRHGQLLNELFENFE